MRKLMLAILILSVASRLSAQRIDAPLYLQHEDSRASVGLQVHGSVASDGLNNRFLSGLLLSDQLDSNQISEQSDALNDNDRMRVGGDYYYELIGRYQIGEGPHSVLFNIGDMGHADSRLSKSVFDLVMRGNASSRGDTVYIDNNFLQFMRYQKVGIGWKYAPTHAMSYSVMASFVNGEAFGRFELDRASLYTSNLGDTLDIDARGVGYLSDTGNVGFAKHNGAGMVLDLGFVHQFESMDRTWTFTATVRDIGFIQWQSKTEQYPIDTAITFTGIAIGEVSSVETSLDQNALEDSLVNGLTNDFSRGKVNQVVPGWLQLEVHQQADKGIVFGGGLTARWMANYRTYGWLNVGYAFTPSLQIESEIGYGGYGKLQVGMHARFTSDRVNCYARVGNLESWVLQDQFGGMSGAFGVQMNVGK